QHLKQNIFMSLPMRNNFHLASGKQKNNTYKLKNNDPLIEFKKPSTDIYNKVLRTGLRPIY
ncbi:hypothetical protein EWW64_23900, partial [Salmonella enterica]|nr:hypothetical protein [Salmonella enterica]